MFPWWPRAGSSNGGKRWALLQVALRTPPLHLHKEGEKKKEKNWRKIKMETIKHPIPSTSWSDPAVRCAAGMQARLRVKSTLPHLSFQKLGFTLFPPPSIHHSNNSGALECLFSSEPLATHLSHLTHTGNIHTSPGSTQKLSHLTHIPVTYIYI